MKPKNVLLILGSHKKSGYTHESADYLERAFKEEGITPARVDVLGLEIAPCLDCPYCEKNPGKCVLNDDMGMVYEKLREAEVVIVLTPVYFNGVTSRLKTLIDRTQMIFMSAYRHKTPYSVAENKGAFVVAFGGAKAYENQFLGVDESLKWVFKSLKMPLLKSYGISGTDHFTKGRLNPETLQILDEIVKTAMESKSWII